MYQKEIDSLNKWFKGIPGAITAFSAGVDSSLVAFLAHRFLGPRAIACISISPSLKRKDYQLAIDFCKEFEIPLEIIETREISDPNYYNNPANRCFCCKTHLYRDLGKVRVKYPNHVLLNGTNTDDFGDYRPGIQAAKDHQVRSPLAECSINKKQVRALARHFGLPNWNKPASPCLSSRVPYGQLITVEKLQQIELAEEILNQYGFSDVRVRHYQQQARIEVPADLVPQLKEKLDNIMPSIKQLGFTDCLIDEEGLVSGKLNRNLPLQHG